MQDATVIQTLGTPKEVAKMMADLGRPVSDKTITAWRLRDRIPGEWRPWVARLAAAKIQGFSTEQFLLSATPRKTPTKREAA